MKSITVPAKIEQLDAILDFINGEMERVDCPMREMTRIAIAAEEVFVNIAHYAYAPGEGNAEIEIGAEAGRILLRFRDAGTPYNPLARADPDVTLDVDERAIGGLGIFMVKKSMDRMEYEYADGQNVLTLVKAWQ